MVRATDRHAMTQKTVKQNRQDWLILFLRIGNLTTWWLIELTRVVFVVDVEFHPNPNHISSATLFLFLGTLLFNMSQKFKFYLFKVGESK